MRKTNTLCVFSSGWLTTTDEFWLMCLGSKDKITILIIQHFYKKKKKWNSICDWLPLRNVVPDLDYKSINYFFSIMNTRLVCFWLLNWITLFACSQFNFSLKSKCKSFYGFNTPEKIHEISSLHTFVLCICFDSD